MFRFLQFLPLALVIAAPLFPQQFKISTVAGAAAPLQAPAFTIPLNPVAVAYDRTGVLYIADQTSVYRVGAQNSLTRVAGLGGRGSTADGGPAVNTGIAPLALALDANGNLYIGENARVRKVDASTGIISTIAGNGLNGFAGDNGPAKNALLYFVQGLAVDSAGNVYISDSGNQRVRKVTAADGIIRTIAGDGTTGNAGAANGDGGQAVSAQLNAPGGLALDGASNLYIADRNDQRIRKVDGGTGVITSVAGNGATGGTGDGGPAVSAQLSYPQAVASDGAGNLYIGDSGSNKVRFVNKANGIISTLAGAGLAGLSGDGGPAASAQLSNPSAVAVDPASNVALVDTGNVRVRVVTASSGVINTVAADGASGDGGSALNALLYFPFSVALDAQGNLYLGDRNRIRKVAAGTNQISTVAGSSVPGHTGDGGPAPSALLYYPNAVASDSAGNLYIAEYNRVRKVTASTGIITTVAGNGSAGFSGDGGPATAAAFNFITALALDNSGNLYLTDTYNQRVRRIDAASGIVTTVAGATTPNNAGGFQGDGGPATSAYLNTPDALTLDNKGGLYIADAGNYRLRKVDLNTGVINTIAGNGTAGFSGDGGSALNAALSPVSGLLISPVGELFLADNGNHRIRKISRTGVITTVAGNGTAAYAGDGGVATSAQLDPLGMANGPFGGIYVADLSNNRVRLLTPQVFGVLDTPPDNAATAGAVGVTGWALSQSGVTKVAVYREPLPGEATDATGLVFLANASQVPGVRPDIANAYPGYPGNTTGWGVQVLTNQLPNTTGAGGLGNGVYRLHAIATDASGQTNDLGVKTISADNAHSNLPFGTIDTPAAGETVSGSSYINFGWALTPQPALIPFDGSTITVYVDGVPQGHPNYGFDRSDIATLFPGLQNTHKGVGYFVLDTTKLANGLHTIQWGLTDSAGHATGIGSRFFNVQN